MITTAEAREQKPFTPVEENEIATVLAKVDEEFASFDGLGFYLTVPADQATSRSMVEVTRRLMAQGWNVSLNFNIAEAPSPVTLRPVKQFLSYLLIIATDAVAENVLRVRREMAQ